jgi:hypothetical protein
MPDYKKLLFDYDTTRENVIPQLDYIGSQYMTEHHNKSISEGKSLTNFDKEPERDFKWMENELNEERFVTTDQELMPEQSSKYRKKINVFLNKHTSRHAPVMNHVLLDPKPTNLFYDPKYDLLHPKPKVLVPNFSVCQGRKSLLPGQRGMLRSESMIETANIGTAGQGYGLAAYTKGQ